MASIPVARLEEMVEQATADCYTDAEQVCDFFTMIDDALAVPFEATVLGVRVTVKRVELTVDDRIDAVCTRAGTRQAIPLLGEADERSMVG